jgi:hypothetical protein
LIEEDHTFNEEATAEPKAVIAYDSHIKAKPQDLKANRRRSLNTHTQEPRYNDPLNNKIPAIKDIISSPSVVNSIIRIPTNNKTPAINNKIFGPFRFVKPRFPCIL